MSRTAPARRLVAAAGALALTAAMAVGAVALAAPASAHGAVSDPPARVYGCYERWSGNHTDPAMQTQDPMCWDAWRANPNAMWNWNGIFKEGAGGNHEQAIPDGKLCSADNPIYDAANTPGAWRTSAKPYDFRLTVHDPSNHGADYLKIYVTKQGYDARTKALAWSDLELVTTTARDTAAPYLADVSIPRDRTGHHVLFTVWQASHLDQPYYQCSDVTFGGGGQPNPTTPAPNPTTPAPNPTTPAPNPTTPAPNPTTPAPNPTTPAPNPGTGACTATVAVQSSWQSGYQATVTVTAGSAAITGWKVTVAGATITQAWNGSASGSTITSASWNGSLAAGATASAGFLGSGSAGNLSATCTTA